MGLRTKLTPRKLPDRGGFSLPFSELRKNTLALYELLSTAQRALENEVAAIEAQPSPSVVVQMPHSILDVQLYSRAVQVFAAMSVEAALNAYGLMRFGAAEFDAYEKLRHGPRRKLLELLDHEYAGRPSDDSEIVQCVDRLVARRNALVHQQSDESTIGVNAVLSYVSDIRWPDVTMTAGTAAIKDMQAFFSTFPNLDGETAGFFHF